MSGPRRVAEEGVEGDHTINIGGFQPKLLQHLLHCVLGDVAELYLHLLKNRYHRLGGIHVLVAPCDVCDLCRRDGTARGNRAAVGKGRGRLTSLTGREVARPDAAEVAAYMWRLVRPARIVVAR